MVYKKPDSQVLKEFLQLFDENIVTDDNISYAFLGVIDTKNGYVAVYNTSAIVIHYMENDLMDFETAEEYVSKNIVTKSTKPNDPMFIDIIPDIFWKS